MFHVRALCYVLQVSKSGYYAWLHRRTTQREQENKRLLQLVQAGCTESHYTYGVRRLTAYVRNQGIVANHKRIARLKALHGIYPNTRKPQNIKTTVVHRNHPVENNHLNRQFMNNHPNQVWVGDITYLKTLQGWVYLAVWLDLCSRKIVGWSIQQHLQTSLVLQAFDRACIHEAVMPHMVHTDRGCQYTSTDFRHKLMSNHVSLSMSRRGNCWDNAVCESFFGTLKTEWTNRFCYRNQEEARSSVFEYIEVFYNRKRLHSSIEYKTPIQYQERAKNREMRVH